MKTLNSQISFKFRTVLSIFASLITSMVILLSTSHQVIAAGKPALLFILDGQSNAGPKGSGKQLQSTWKQIVPDTLILPKVEKFGWIPANPYEVANKFDKSSSSFGVELSFLKTLKPYYPNTILAVAQDSYGGASIICWEKNHSTPEWKQDMINVGNGTGDQAFKLNNPQYPDLMETKNKAVATLLARDDVSSVTLAGVLWVQGEQDVGRTYGALRYEANLKKLISNVRQDWNSPRLPFLFLDSHSKDPDNPNVTIFDAAVAQVATDVPNTAMINTRDLQTWPDGVHFNTSGTVNVGVRLATAYREKIQSPTTPEPPVPLASPTLTAGPSPIPSNTPTSGAVLTADFNDDGVVNLADLLLFIPQFNTTVAKFDLNKTGRVDIFDFNVVIGNLTK